MHALPDGSGLRAHWDVQVLPIDRGQGLQQQGMQAAQQRLSKGDWVHVFPEGTRSLTGRTGQAKRGVGRLIAACDTPPLGKCLHTCSSSCWRMLGFPQYIWLPFMYSDCTPSRNSCPDNIIIYAEHRMFVCSGAFCAFWDGAGAPKRVSSSQAWPEHQGASGRAYSGGRPSAYSSSRAVARARAVCRHC